MRVVHPFPLSIPASKGAYDGTLIQAGPKSNGMEEPQAQARHALSNRFGDYGAGLNSFHPPNNAPLGALAGGVLSSHFHGWKGLSGQRYVCSIFPVIQDDQFGGLPDFSVGIALATRRSEAGHYKLVRIFEFSWREEGFCGNFRDIEVALGQGAEEWHVHLLAGDVKERRAAIADLGGLMRIL